MILRDYQLEAKQALYQYWANKIGKNPVVVMPTGAGKSLLIADFIKDVCSNNPKVRVLILAHVKELIEQNRMELIKHWEDARTGVYSAGLNEKNTWAPVIFAGIQSVYKHVNDLGKIDIVIVDEAHMIPRTSQTRYKTFLNDMLKANPNVVIWGTTATPYRLDSGLLCEGKDALFDGIAYSADMKKLIADGYLVPVISKGGVEKINLSGVHIQAGEYKANELAHAADDPELVKLAVEEIVKYGETRRAWLLFASGVAHAEHVVEEIKKYNITAKIITGETEDNERDKIVGDFRAGKIRALVNVMVLTTGFNAPICDMIALLTATQSTGKYVQMVGRGMRTYPDKTDTLLLDYGNNVLTHGTIDEVDPVNRKTVFGEVKKAAPMKECPKCHVLIASRCTICPSCAFEFPVVAAHGTEAYEGAILSTQQEAFFVDIAENGFYVSRHQKTGKPDMAKIEFADAMDKEYNIYLCLNHGGFAASKAQAVVRTFGGRSTTTEDALKEWPYWRKPVRIKVMPDGKFTKVVGIIFEDKIDEEQKKRIGEKDICSAQNDIVSNKCGSCTKCTIVTGVDSRDLNIVGYHCDENQPDWMKCQSQVIGLPHRPMNEGAYIKCQTCDNGMLLQSGWYCTKQLKPEDCMTWRSRSVGKMFDYRNPTGAKS